MTWLPWAQAWQEALYGEHGFYRRGTGPAGHFATSAQGLPGAGELYAAALVRLLDRESLSVFVDVGAGHGELLAHVRRLAPHVHCIGVDVAGCPDLPPGVQWLSSPGGAALPDSLGDLRDVLVLANEWLDVVPCPVAELDDAGVLREVLVDPDSGDERLGERIEDALSPPSVDWVGRHWPLAGAAPGDRVEVGRARDAAWAGLLDRVDSGVAIAADYGHLRGSRPAPGTLSGFRDGHQVRPLPDGSGDVTAHVAVDSLDHDALLTQREALRGMGVEGSLPRRDLAVADPTAYLHALSATGAAATLTRPGGLGGFWWAVRRAGEGRGSAGLPWGP